MCVNVCVNESMSVCVRVRACVRACVCVLQGLFSHIIIVMDVPKM